MNKIWFSSPLSPTEHHSFSRSSARALFEPESRFSAIGELASARLKRGAEGTAHTFYVCAVGGSGVLSLGYFSLHKQREVTQGAGAKLPAISG